MGSSHGMHDLDLHQLALHNQQQQLQRRRSSRYGLRAAGGCGAIVEVQGGHIVRSTGRKDRHSKVCTAKGPRDRRVRLAAHTAIQFYDVQDRLGYDRPSKAVDWLMKNAKASIDELAELPPWTPTATKGTAAVATSSSRPPARSNQSAEQPTGDSNGKAIQIAQQVGSTSLSFGGDNSNTGFLPSSLDSDAIADTIKSFFPMAAATSPSSSTTIGFQNYHVDLLSRTSSHTQDLRLSLQSFPEAPPASHHPQSTQQYHSHSSAPFEHGALFSVSANLAFDEESATWAEQNQRTPPWNDAADASGFPTPRPAVPLHSVLDPGLFFSQRGPLQSSNSPSARAWPNSVAADDHQMLHPALHPSMSSVGLASGVGFSGFRIPARIQGEEVHGGIYNKPPSASSASLHR